MWKRRADGCFQILTGTFGRSRVPDDRQVVVRIEMSLARLELGALASIDDRFTKSFSIARLPVGSQILVSQIRENEVRTLDLHAQTVIDEARSRYIIQL